MNHENLISEFGKAFLSYCTPPRVTLLWAKLVYFFTNIQYYELSEDS
jgi:hypothetical protein